MKSSPNMYENRKREKIGYEGNVVKVAQVPEFKEKTSDKNTHAQHRQRLRARFRKEGLDSFEDHNVLELLLFFGIPFKDVNETAHDLLEHFGSLSDVLDAKYEDLCKVKGISENSATLIKLIPELFRRYELDKLNKDGIILNSAELVAKYSSKYFKGVKEERLYLLCLDSNCRLISCNLISTGTVSSTPINNRLIAEYAYAADAANLILVHNHPSGIAAPSKQDVDVTTMIIDTMRQIGLRLADHVIVGLGDDYFSFKTSPKWKCIF